MIDHAQFAYFRHECELLDIKVKLDFTKVPTRINVMDAQFDDLPSAMRYVNSYQAEQGARWAAFNRQSQLSEVRS